MLFMGIIFLYFFSQSILFNTQSMIHFFCVAIALIYLKNAMTKLNFRSLKVEHMEWISTIRFYIFIKIWHMVSIRLWDIKLYRLIKLVKFVQTYLRRWVSAANKVWKLHYIDSIRKSSLDTMMRLDYRVKYLYYWFQKKETGKLLTYANVKKDNRHLVTYDYNV